MTVAVFLPVSAKKFATVTDRRYTAWMPERLRRLSEIFAREPVFFLTAATHGGAAILANPLVHEAIKHFVELGRERGAWIEAYVLMPDHLPAIVALGREAMSLSM